MNQYTKSNERDDRLAMFDACFREHYDVLRRPVRVPGSDDLASECFAVMWRKLDVIDTGVERAGAK